MRGDVLFPHSWQTFQLGMGDRAGCCCCDDVGFLDALLASWEASWGVIRGASRGRRRCRPSMPFWGGVPAAPFPGFVSLSFSDRGGFVLARLPPLPAARAGGAWVSQGCLEFLGATSIVPRSRGAARGGGGVNDARPHTAGDHGAPRVAGRRRLARRGAVPWPWNGLQREAAAVAGREVRRGVAIAIAAVAIAISSRRRDKEKKQEYIHHIVVKAGSINSAATRTRLRST